MSIQQFHSLIWCLPATKWHFSTENYGDRVARIDILGRRGKYTKKLDNRATEYIATVKAFSEACWHKIFEDAKGFMVEKRRSRPSSEDVEVRDVILLSDD